jgi:hypothetical protein
MKHLVPSLHEPVREVRRQRVVPKRRRSFRVFVVSGELVPRKAQRGREGGGGSRSASSSRHLFFQNFFSFVSCGGKKVTFQHSGKRRSREEEEELRLRKEGERERERLREREREQKTKR